MVTMEEKARFFDLAMQGELEAQLQTISDQPPPDPNVMQLTPKGVIFVAVQAMMTPEIEAAVEQAIEMARAEGRRQARCRVLHRMGLINKTA